LRHKVKRRRPRRRRVQGAGRREQACPARRPQPARRGL